MLALKTGLGGEVTDRSYTVSGSCKAQWILAPLPLSQIDPSAAEYELVRRGPIRSLQSSCYQVISRSFHLYTPSSLDEVPSHLIQRILSRVRLDRNYEDVAITATKPDEATIWAYSALSDPECTASHIIELPVTATLQHLKPNPNLPQPFHPFIQIPILYASIAENPISLLTSLTLHGVDNLVNDKTIQNLRFCTHLTALWMRGCLVTDAGIRLLASSLELPGPEGGEGRGMWRLRGWWLPGCYKVTDVSMKVFAKWPGLVILDLRKTSCTTAGITIYNRACKTIFDKPVPLFQPCTDGLKPLFSAKETPTQILSNLSVTLLAIISAISLSIVTSTTPIPDEYLPQSSVIAKREKTYPTGRPISVYRTGGVGQIYGTSVTQVPDEEHKIRSDVATALQLQAEEDEDYHREIAGLKPIDRRTKFWDSPPRKKTRKPKIFKESAKERKDRSKAFYMATKNARQLEEGESDEVVPGRIELMMVRMVDDDWDKLVWKRAEAAVEESVIVGRSVATGKSQKGKSLLGDILGSTKSVSTKTENRYPIAQFSSSPAKPHLPSPPKSSPTDTSRTTNPFKKTTPTTTGGVRPLSSKFTTSEFAKPKPPPAQSKPLSQSSSQSPPKSTNPFKKSSQPVGVRPLVIKSATLITKSSAGPEKKIVVKGKKREMEDTREEAAKKMKNFFAPRTG